MITLRKCTCEDIEDLKKISSLTFIDTFGKQNTEEDMQNYIMGAYSDHKLKEELSEKSSMFYFALQQGRVVGYLKLNIDEAQTEKMAENSLEVERIYVLPTVKRQGIGTILLNFAIDQAVLLKKTSIWLGVWEHNTKALNFYKKMNFEIVDKHVFVLGKDEQTDLLMQRKL